MERIAKKYYPEMTLDFCTEVDCLARPFCPGLKKNNRLYEYEETGLTPEEIVKMQRIIACSEMPRLIIPESKPVSHYGAPVVFYGGKEDVKIRPLVYRWWIRTDEELPGQEKVGKYYAQYGEHPQYIVMIAHAVKPTILAFDGEDFYDPYTNELYKVTHWMELPPEPEKNKT